MCFSSRTRRGQIPLMWGYLPIIDTFFNGVLIRFFFIFFFTYTAPVLTQNWLVSCRCCCRSSWGWRGPAAALCARRRSPGAELTGTVGCPSSTLESSPARNRTASWWTGLEERPKRSTGTRQPGWMRGSRCFGSACSLRGSQSGSGSKQTGRCRWPSSWRSWCRGHLRPGPALGS